MFRVEADFSMSDVEDYINSESKAWFDEIVDGLRQTGRRLVDKARAKTREDGGFGNITWNLRASIGMCLVDETGKIVDTYFPPLGKGAHGNMVGREMAERLALYVSEGDSISMVFVAGEEYASLVQANGRDVIKYVIGDNLGPALREILGS